MILLILWAFTALMGVKCECIVSNELKTTMGVCTADLVCDGSAEMVLQIVRNRFSCIKHDNQYNSYYNQWQRYNYDSNYDLSVLVKDVDISNSEQPLIGLLEIADKVITLEINGGNLVSTPTQATSLLRLRKFSITNNNIESINLNKFLNMEYLQMVNTSHNLISTVEIDVDINAVSGSINTIDLSHNFIEFIPDNCFARFSQLKYLDLSFNKLSNFDILTFEGMMQIETLLLSNNKIIEIGQNFARFIKLKRLYLDHNNLRTLTDLNFRMLTKLEYFNVSSNFIKNIEEKSLSALINLQELDLSYNNIKVINKTLFENNFKMNKLFLLHNDIENLEGGPFKSNNISYFDIRGNPLSMQVEYNTFQGVHVSNLDLSGGNLKSLSDRAFSTFGSKLNYLNLSMNRIENISLSAFESLTDLSILDLSYNKLIDIDFNVNDLKELSEYYLQRNSIKKITPNMFNNLRLLRILDLSYNAIEEIEINSFSEIPNLNYLNFSNNYLSSSVPVGIFSGLHKVTCLDLSYTRVMSYQNMTFVGMLSLLNLNSSYSQLEKIEYEAFQGTGALQIIDLSHNMLESFYINTSNILEVLELYLNHNKIKNVQDDTFKNLTHLKRLNLASNNILHISSSSLQTLTQLNYLNLSSNINLKFSDQIFNNLIVSQVLLTNIIQLFSFENSANASISTLMLNYCKIENLNSVFIHKIKNILKLDLSSNKIKFLDKGSFQSMKVLNWLDLSLNMINDIRPGTFRYTNMINILNLSGNNLQYLPFGVLDGLKNLRFLNISNNALHTFGPNLLYSTPHLSNLSLENNNLASIDFIEFSKTNVKFFFIGGNIISCDVLARLKKINLTQLSITAESLDFNTENINGINCRTNLIKNSINGSGNNSSEIVLLKSTVESLYSNLTIILNEIVSKSGISLEKTLSHHIENITDLLKNTQISTNAILSRFVNESIKLHTSTIDENNSLSNKLQLITTLLEVNNNLTKYGTEELNRAIAKDATIKDERKVLTSMKTEKYQTGALESNLQYPLTDIKMLLSRISLILYCIVASLAVIIICYFLLILHQQFKRNTVNRLRKNELSESDQPIQMDIEME